MNCTGVPSFFHHYHESILVYSKVCLNHSYSPKFTLTNVILFFGFPPTFMSDKSMQLILPLTGLRGLQVTFPPHDPSDVGSNPVEVGEFLRTEKFREQVLWEGL
jgi:hypothetical protein